MNVISSRQSWRILIMCFVVVHLLWHFSQLHTDQPDFSLSTISIRPEAPILRRTSLSMSFSGSNFGVAQHSLYIIGLRTQPPPPETRGELAARCATSISSSDDLDFWVEKMPQVIRWKPQLWLAGVAPLTSCEQHYKAHTVASTLVLPRWQLLGCFGNDYFSKLTKTPRWAADGTAKEPGHTHTHTHMSYPRVSSVNRHPSVCQQDTRSHTHAEG